MAERKVYVSMEVGSDELVSEDKKDAERVSVFVVWCNYVFRFGVLWVILRIVSDVDTIEDWFVDWDMLFYLPGSVSAVGALLVWQFLRDCYRRWRYGRWFHGQLALPKKWILGAAWWAALIPLVLLLSWAFDTRSKETVEGIAWRYRIENGNVIVCREHPWHCSAISVATVGDLVIPSSLGGHPVTCIGEFAFYKCKKLTSITIPKGVVNVAHGAFQGCPIKTVYVEKGDAERVKKLLLGKGIDVDKVEFVEREETQATPVHSAPANGQVK